MYKTIYHIHTDERKKQAKKADEQIIRRRNVDNNDARFYVREAVLELQPHTPQAEPPANNQSCVRVNKLFLSYYNHYIMYWPTLMRGIICFIIEN